MNRAAGSALLPLLVAIAGCTKQAAPVVVLSCAVTGDPVSIPAGSVLLGEDGVAADGAVQEIEAFNIDRHEVTNRQFAAFVAATGYVTQAEREGGGAVFVAPDGPVNLDDPSNWWRYVKGSSWRQPTGPGSSNLPDYPVVQVSFEDAQAYAAWVGRELPTVEQWEHAARAGQTQPRAQTAWAYASDGRSLANTWQGVFPIDDKGRDGHQGIAPVGCFPANDYGVVDMVGNVWEWTTQSGDALEETRIIKGGSFLCAMNYCANFRPAAWQAQERDLPTSHVGFRTVSSD